MLKVEEVIAGCSGIFAIVVTIGMICFGILSIVDFILHEVMGIAFRGDANLFLLEFLVLFVVVLMIIAALFFGHRRVVSRRKQKA